MNNKETLAPFGTGHRTKTKKTVKHSKES